MTFMVQITDRALRASGNSDLPAGTQLDDLHTRGVALVGYTKDRWVGQKLVERKRPFTVSWRLRGETLGSYETLENAVKAAERFLRITAR